jgi:ATP-binding cassette, subfamily B, bacterial
VDMGSLAERLNRQQAFRTLWQNYAGSQPVAQTGQGDAVQGDLVLAA